MVFILVSVVPIMIFYNIMITFVQNHYQTDREESLKTSAVILAGNIEPEHFLDDPAIRRSFVREIEARSQENSFRILIVDSMSIVVTDSHAIETGNVLLIPQIVEAFSGNTVAITHRDERTIYAATSITNAYYGVLGAVLIVASVEDIFATIDDIEQGLFIFTGVTIFLLGIVAFFVSQLILDPLQNFLRVVEKMGAGQLDVRIKINGYDEYSELGKAFNDMAESLEKAEKIREDFVSNVSHELKTPLSSMKVLSESILLQEDVPTELYKEFLQDINSEIDRMSNIVQDLLNLVKLNHREAALITAPVNLNTMAEDIIKRLLPLAQQKNITLSFEGIKKVTLEADEMKLSLAISNVVENSIKYTDNGGNVNVMVDSDHQNAFITVHDTGIGISEEEQKKIFQRFYRVDKTRDRETGGSGLGLSITRSTVLMHGGSIRVSSKENEGTTFVVRIPITKINEGMRK